MTALTQFRAGLVKAPAPPQLRFSSYFKDAILPPVPATFDRGRYFLPRTAQNPFPLGMLGNNIRGNCTIAGPDHIDMLWNKLVGISLRITTADALDDYRDACGWDPNNPDATDNGGDMVSVASYWQKTGMRDSAVLADGLPRRHQIAAYVAIDPSDYDHLIAASYLFDGGVGLGLALPDNAEQQFIAGEPWSGKAPNDDDFHFVPLAYVGSDGLPHVYTWGADQPAQKEFIVDNCREAVGYVSSEALRGGRSIEGFMLADLLADAKAISA